MRLLAAAFVLTVASSSWAEHRQIADRIAAVVDGDIILLSELEQRMLPLRAGIADIGNPVERERRLAQLTRQLLDEMVNDELVLQAARAAKITVSDAEVDQALAVIQKDNKLDAAGLAKAMREQGVTRETIRDSLVRHRAVNTMIAPKIQIAPEDVRARYDQLQRRAHTVTSVKVSQIVFGLPDQATPADIARTTTRAQAVVDRARAGEPFAALAADVAGEHVATTDGVWLDAGTVIPELEHVVFGMDQGDVRGPIRGPAGLYVVFADEVRRTQLQAFADMKDQLESELRQKSLVRLTQTWIDELRKKAYIEIKTALSKPEAN